MLRHTVLTTFVLLMTGCHLQPAQRPSMTLKLNASGPFAMFRRPPATWEECAGLDRSAVGWTASGVLFGALGAGGGGGAAAAEDPTIRYTVGGVAAGLSVFAAMSTFLGSHYAKRYVDRCSVNDGGRAENAE